MPTEIKNYRCDFCQMDGFGSYTEAREHESQCLANPEVAVVWETCCTCHGTGNLEGSVSHVVITCPICEGKGRRKRGEVPSCIQKSIEYTKAAIEERLTHAKSADNGGV